MELHIDIETYSSVDLKNCGAYKYIESEDFQILMVAYAVDDDLVRIVDLAQGETLPEKFIGLFKDPTVEKHAHNAVFERKAFEKIGLKRPYEEWFCSAVKSAYCGLPLALDKVSKALNLKDKAKSGTGKTLIKYFCEPCRPTKTNGQRTRNLPEHNMQKWEAFKEYCKQDVVAEREVEKRLKRYELPEKERDIYILDQKINDRGVLLDLDFAKKASVMDDQFKAEVKKSIKEIAGIENPNSLPQLKKWMCEETGKKEIKSLDKEAVSVLLEEFEQGAVSEVLNLRKKLGKSSTAKYKAMLKSACSDDRGRGYFQFYGASTGRWAGRLVQLQNLARNYLQNIQIDRDFIKTGDYEVVNLIYDDVPAVLSQLVRTGLTAKRGGVFAVADFSAIEARVIAWLANERWRLDVFNSHGKIYEASASMMFGVPMEQVTKDSDYRAKGKVAELALGYQGAVGALKQMGGEKMGLSEEEMDSIVKRWRRANPSIVNLWRSVEKSAMLAVKNPHKTVKDPHRGLVFFHNGLSLTIKLPSGRQLFYQSPSFTTNKYERQSLRYKGKQPITGVWGWVDTYGGKLVENIVQAIARDLLVETMLKLDDLSYEIVMHVHDEVVCDIPKDGTEENELKKIESVMGEPVSWAEGLPLSADGYLTPFYKKD